MMSWMRRLALVGVAGAGTQATLADWPQWRGPQQDGVAPAGGALAEAWPANGPTKLWQSAPIENDGAYGSPIVADNRILLFVNLGWKEPFATRTLSAGALKTLGASAVTLPPDLAKDVDKARASPERAAVDKAKLNEWSNAWIKDHLSADQTKLFHDAVFDRLRRGSEALPMDVLARLAKIQDREFPDQASLDKWFDEQPLDPNVRKAVMQQIPTFLRKGQDAVFCYDAADGKRIWKTDFPGQAGRASSTPTVAQGRCYVTGSQGNVYCLDLAGGKEVWQAQPSKGELQSSVLVADGVAVVAAGGMLLAYDAATGQPLWQQKNAANACVSPVRWTSGGKTYVISNTDANEKVPGTTVGVDIKTGKTVWTVAGGGSSTPCVAGGFLILNTGNKDLGILAYRLSETNPVKIWSVASVDQYSCPVVHKGYVYVVGERAVCVDLSSGKVAWEEAKAGCSCSSAVLADSKLYNVAGGALIMVRATPEKYDLLAKSKVRGRLWTSAAVSGDRIYLHAESGVSCFDLAKPAAAQAVKP